jgi:hypothetical protein
MMKVCLKAIAVPSGLTGVGRSDSSSNALTFFKTITQPDQDLKKSFVCFRIVLAL